MEEIFTKSKKQHDILYWSGGVAFTFFIALLGYLAAYLPGLNQVGQLATAIIIAIIYRQIFGYPERLRSGIQFSSKKLLRIAIILYGIKLNISIILKDGIGLLILDAGIITFAILLTIWLAKLFKAEQTISFLAGVGTGVCGAAAIAAVAPIIKSKDEDTAISVAIIALIGTVFSIVYTIFRPILPLSEDEYGVWSGISLHELAHVALAAEPAGENALALALLGKLCRVFLLIPLCFIIISFIRSQKHGQAGETATNKIDFPWFLVGFIVMSLLGSYLLGPVIPVSSQFMDSVAGLTTWLLTAAMVGLGLSISLHDLRTKALKPLLVVLVTSVCLSLITYFIV